MAYILPLRPWRYNTELTQQLDTLVSPLFDVASVKQRKVLYQHPYNSIHLSVPQPPDAAQRAQLRVQEWKQQGIIVQDKLPAIYVYYQYFKLAGNPNTFCRKGFICHIRTYAWHEQVIMRHENTIPKAVNDRIDLLEKTALHVNATHGLYTDELHLLEPYMDSAIANPIYETEDYQGVRDVLGVIHDLPTLQTFIEVLRSKKIILADGHHRYEGSLLHQEKCKAANPNHTGHEGYNFHLMYLTNTESDDLRILPTHRLIRDLANFNEADILEKIGTYFTIKPVEDADTLNEIIVGKQWAFGLLFKDNAYKIRLKPEVFEQLSWPFPEVVKKLDLTVMHYFIIEKVFGILGKDQRQSTQIDFDRSFSDCLSKVIQGEAQLAIITNEVSIEDVKQVCASGHTMPQKSTYFYPKVIGGFLFSSIDEEEFRLPHYAPF